VLAVRNSPLLDEFLAARYQAVADDALKLKLIRRPVSVDGWFEPRYLNAALQKANLAARWTAFNAQGQPAASERQASAAAAR
jgi:sulfonate transport system substrate-binding protein